ncbi:hypothetical protein [Roseobacter sp.]|uniref:hypothetical protein n=1 Tax=Roseobacter sp. TaxID=1907202 RepID=UPI00385E453E
MTVKTVGLDLAKDVFQVHGILENGRVIFNKAIKRAKLLSFFESLPPCTVAWKRAVHPIIGAVSFASSAMM